MLNSAKNHITVFEYESIYYDRGSKQLTKDQYDALDLYHGDGVPYYKMVRHGVQFKEYVGVIQIGKTLIEVLPKADRNSISNKVGDWRKMLIGMMRAVGSFDIHDTSSSNLKIKPNTILDLYIEMFIKEVEYLLHNGLAKKYRKREENATALKGNLMFNKQM